MKATDIIRNYVTTNGIMLEYIAERSGMSVRSLRQSLEGKRLLKADEFISVCKVLKLDFDYFNSIQSGKQPA